MCLAPICAALSILSFIVSMPAARVASSSLSQELNAITFSTASPASFMRCPSSFSLNVRVEFHRPRLDRVITHLRGERDLGGDVQLMTAKGAGIEAIAEGLVSRAASRLRGATGRLRVNRRNAGHGCRGRDSCNAAQELPTGRFLHAMSFLHDL
jgi:hypothetical protein